MHRLLRLGLLVFFSVSPALAEAPGPLPPLELLDIFELEYVGDPRISPDGELIVYERRTMDIQKDRVRSDLWILSSKGKGHRPLITGVDASMARWSPDGTRLVYRAKEEDKTELFVYYLESGSSARLAQLPHAPGGLAWSPDGRQIAFTRLVETPAPSLVDLPAAPEGAEWAPAPKYIEAVLYRADGQGLRPSGFEQIFVVSAEGGTPRQLTRDPFHHPARHPPGRRMGRA